MRYSSEFIEQALIKVHARDGQTVREVATDLGVNFYTVQRWLKVHKIVRTDVADKERRPHEWRREEQLGALLETHALNEEQLHAWCRERGLFPHHLEQWRVAFCVGEPTKPPSTLALTKENAKLKKELQRKEKALAEAAALLVLQKKFQALWVDEEE